MEKTSLETGFKVSRFWFQGFKAILPDTNVKSVFDKCRPVIIQKSSKTAILRYSKGAICLKYHHYKTIITANQNKSGIPESFNVLVKEMRSLGLNVELTNSMAAANALPPSSEAAE